MQDNYKYGKSPNLIDFIKDIFKPTIKSIQNDNNQF